MKNVKPKEKGAVRAVKTHRHSIKQQMVFSFVLYALILLILLWSLFFIVLYIMRPFFQNDFKRRCHAASIAFPFTLDNRSLDIYKAKLKDIALGESIALAVFTFDGGETELVFSIDTLGNVAEESHEVFDVVMTSVDFDKIFLPGGNVDVIDTSIGRFFAYGSKHEVDDHGLRKEAFFVAVTPAKLFDFRTKMVIIAMLFGTVLVIGASIIASLVLSKYQTKRLTNISKDATKLANGDFSVVFSGGGCDEYDELAAALNTAKDEMSKVESIQREMIANVSHDLRTPLTMIRASAELLRDLPVDDKKRVKTAKLIVDEADRLNVFVNDVLRLSKLQGGAVELKLEPVDISDMAETVIGRFGIFEERDGVKFVREIDDGVTVTCDSENITRCLYNFINNAINYSGDDKTVTVRVKRIDDGARVEVSDRGKGIAPEELDKVWDRYYRAAHSKRATVGTGIGLSICRSILELHGAEYGLTSELGKGTTFWFELKTRGGATFDNFEAAKETDLNNSE